MPRRQGHPGFEDAELAFGRITRERHFRIQRLQRRSGSSNGPRVRFPDIMLMRVLVADDNQIVRKALCDLLETDPRIAPCIEAANGEEAVDVVKTTRPDAVILDLSMPGMNGLDAARAIRELRPGIPIILCSIHGEHLSGQTMFLAAITALVPKRNAGTQLLPAIWALLSMAPITFPLRTSRADG
jgi:two-component system chemotaxis response regulator CheY